MIKRISIKNRKPEAYSDRYIASRQSSCYKASFNLKIKYLCESLLNVFVSDYKKKSFSQNGNLTVFMFLNFISVFGDFDFIS